MEQLTMEKTSSGKKQFPLTRVLTLLVIVIFGMGMVVGLAYVDYLAGSESSSFLPGGLEVSGITRGFNSGGTGIDSSGESGTAIVNVAGKEFVVSPTEVTANGKQIARVNKSTKSLKIISYRGTIDIEADGKIIASVN